jgi:geranylgeranyl diphosphate synthase, type II
VTTVETTAVEHALAAYGERTAGALAAQLAEHLGSDGPAAWLDDLVRDYPSRGGKAIRPGLCLATCVAFGGSIDEGLPSAVAIELLHNAFLVHDDIEDESLLRRGRPTLHEGHGVPLALNAGDALFVLAGAVLGTNRRLLGGRMAARVADEFTTMARHTVSGQATELGWRRDGIVALDPQDYVDLIMRKTCWYTTVHPLRVGALIGSWGRADLDAMVRFGAYLGAAFQIRDDLLNLEGDEHRYGKEHAGDIYEGKRTLMLIHLLSVARPTVREELVAFLACRRHERTAEAVARVVDLLRDHGSLEFARSFGQGIADAATHAFEIAFADVPDSAERRFVHDLIAWMLDRAA